MHGLRKLIAIVASADVFTLMNIERILQIGKNDTDKDILKMILSNRITHYLGDDAGAAIAIKSWDTLIDDILKWQKNKSI